MCVSSIILRSVAVCLCAVFCKTLPIFAADHHKNFTKISSSFSTVCLNAIDCICIFSYSPYPWCLCGSGVQLAAYAGCREHWPLRYVPSYQNRSPSEGGLMELMTSHQWRAVYLLDLLEVNDPVYSKALTSSLVSVT